MTLTEELSALEAGYWDQPVSGQRTDLVRINCIRSELGLTCVDAYLRTRTPDAKQAQRVAEAKKDTHERARAIYAEYRHIVDELAPHREYTLQVEKATGRGSMTCVEPLATMGTNGGPLLCDYCGKPMLLEGGTFNRVYADVAWLRQSPVLRINWVSYISGGMVIENLSNGTLRIYHGHTHGTDNECATKAKAERDEKEARHSNSGIRDNCKIVTQFVNESDGFKELSRDERVRLVNEILNTVFGFNPGIGINRP